MEIGFNVKARSVFLWLGFAAIFFVLGTIFVIRDEEGAGLVFFGMAFLAAKHFYLLLLPIFGLCRDAYLWKERVSRKVARIERFSGTIVFMLLYLASLALAIRIFDLR